MLHDRSGEAASVAGDRDAPPGTDDLPPRYNRRWSAQQQRQVLRAIDDGTLTAAEAILRYALGRNDLAGWRDAVAARPAGAVAPSPPIDRMTRLIEVLVKRGVIDAFDAAAIGQPRGNGLRGDGLATLFAEFIVDDAPIV